VALLFHGYAAAKDQLLETARALHEQGWSTLLVDFRGSGGSSGTSTTIGWREADDVVAIMAWARSELGCSEPVLMGFSMGGAAVLRAVGALGAQPRAVVVEATFDALLPTVRHRFETMGLPSFPAAELLVLWGGALGGFDAFEHAPVRYAQAVQVPTLVVQGSEDERVREHEARAIVLALGPWGQLELVQGLAHEPLATAQPERWAQVVPAFLER